jgi:hypothetical protein
MNKSRSGSMNFRLPAMGLFLCASLLGCATPPKPYEEPMPVPLEVPVPGRALVYLLRAPYDRQQLEITLSGKKVAVLPGSSYTAISATPGIYMLRTQVAGILGAGGEEVQPMELNLKADERRFLCVSGHTAKTVEFSGIFTLPNGALAPIPMPQTGTALGTRSWKEITELDAQGLMSISRPVLPER